MSESEPKPVETIEGDSPPEDVFQPHRMGVELFAVFEGHPSAFESGVRGSDASQRRE